MILLIDSLLIASTSFIQCADFLVRYSNLIRNVTPITEAGILFVPQSFYIETASNLAGGPRPLSRNKGLTHRVIELRGVTRLSGPLTELDPRPHHSSHSRDATKSSIVNVNCL